MTGGERTGLLIVLVTMAISASGLVLLLRYLLC